MKGCECCGAVGRLYEVWLMFNGMMHSEILCINCKNAKQGYDSYEALAQAIA